MNPIRRPDYLLNDDHLELTEKRLGKGHYAEVVEGVLNLEGTVTSIQAIKCRRFRITVGLFTSEKKKVDVPSRP